MLIYNLDREISLWVASVLGIRSMGPGVSIGVVRNGELVAGAVYKDYRHPSIEISFASTTPRWATKQAIKGIFAYPFLQLKCKRITAVTQAKNQPARAFLCRLGFKEEGSHPDFFESDDGVSYGMLKSDCHWLAEELHEQSALPSTAG